MEGSHAFGKAAEYFERVSIGTMINGVCIERTQETISYDLRRRPWEIYFQCPQEGDNIRFAEGLFIERATIFSVFKKYSAFRMSVKPEPTDEWRRLAGGQYEKVSASMVSKSKSGTDMHKVLWHVGEINLQKGADTDDAAPMPVVRPRTTTINEPVLGP